MIVNISTLASMRESPHIVVSAAAKPRLNVLTKVSAQELGARGTMRTVGMARRALDLMLERAVSRRTQGELLSKKQMVQEMVAESWLDLEQFRLLVLRTAWKIDKYKDYKRVRGDISGVKAAMPGVLRRIASRALQVHGSLGTTEEMPFMAMIANAYHLGFADGPTEIHKVTLARSLFSTTMPAPGLWPTAHIPAQREAALSKYADVLARVTSA